MKRQGRVYVVGILVMMLLATSLFSCDSNKTIPDKDLEKILSDAILRQSVITANKKGSPTNRTREDSIDYHSDILAHYGYTFEDYNYTITQLARRKSNPLEGILEKVANGIEQRALYTEHRYNVERKFDTLSLDYYRDTIFKLDSLFRTPYKDARFVILDTLYNGDYHIVVHFQSSTNYLHAQHRMDMYFSDTTTKNSTDMKSMWLSRSADERTIEHTYVVEDGVKDSLVISFKDVVSDYIRKRRKGQTYDKDTSYVRNIEVVYTPNLAEARERYYKTLFGEDFTIYVPYMQYEYQEPKGVFTLELPQIDSLRLDSLRLDSLRLDSLRLDSLRLDSLNLNQITKNATKKDSSATSAK